MCERCVELEKELADAALVLYKMGRAVEEIYLSRLSSRQASRVAQGALAEYRSWAARHLPD